MMKAKGTKCVLNSYTCKVQHWVLVNSQINICIPLKVLNFLTSLVTTSYLRTLLHGVSCLAMKTIFSLDGFYEIKWYFSRMDMACNNNFIIKRKDTVTSNILIHTTHEEK
jgi:hypothetical protein